MKFIHEESSHDLGNQVFKFLFSGFQSFFAVEKDSNENVVAGESRRGRCKWFNVLKGFGFIVPEDGGQEVFVHQSVIKMGGFRSVSLSINYFEHRNETFPVLTVGTR